MKIELQSILKMIEEKEQETENRLNLESKNNQNSKQCYYELGQLNILYDLKKLIYDIELE